VSLRRLEIFDCQMVSRNGIHKLGVWCADCTCILLHGLGINIGLHIEVLIKVIYLLVRSTDKSTCVTIFKRSVHEHGGAAVLPSHCLYAVYSDVHHYQHTQMK